MSFHTLKLVFTKENSFGSAQINSQDGLDIETKLLTFQ